MSPSLVSDASVGCPGQDDSASTDQARARFTFQQQWFEQIRPEWEALTSHMRSQRLSILEIGSFEGASTTWILDHLMSHAESRMVAIDTFEGGIEHQSDGAKYGLSSLEARFRSNVSKCKNANKLQIMKAKSDDALLSLRRDGATFDFVYIDASHVAIDVLHDAVVCWRMLHVGGTMVFDDYSWKGYMEDCYNPRMAITAFLECAAPEIETRETESQMWVKRVERKGHPTPNPDPYLYYWDKGLAKKPT